MLFPKQNDTTSLEMKRESGSLEGGGGIPRLLRFARIRRPCLPFRSAADHSHNTSEQGLASIKVSYLTATPQIT